jgi:hypothetical protein
MAEFIGRIEQVDYDDSKPTDGETRHLDQRVTLGRELVRSADDTMQISAGKRWE